MAQPTHREVHVDAILTNISIAYIQDTANFVADRVFPRVPVNKQSDKYFTYDKDDWFRDEAQRRPPSSESAGGGYNLSTDTYSCDVYAFHKDIDARVLANYDQPLAPRRDATEFVTQKMLLRREKEFLDNYVGSGIWDTEEDGSGADFAQWDDYDNSNPITDVTQWKREVHNTTGFMPNGLLIGGEVWDALKDHPEILDRVKYTREAIDINPSLIARALDIDNLIIAEGIQAVNIEGEDEDMEALISDEGLLFYAPTQPSLLTPAAGYIFTWTNYLSNAYGVEMSQFYMDSIKSTRIEGEIAFDTKVVASDLGVYIENILQ